MRDTSSNRAVVLGASMAGLLAARVLAERFERVVVIERDVLPSAGEHRRGVPHGRHVHGLHPRGREILEELFPGFTASLTAGGAVHGDVLGTARWQLSGHQLRQADIGLPGLLATRPFLEGHLRAMVRRLPGVGFLEDTSACGLTVTADKRTVTGVEVRGPGGGRPAQVAAGLVVDATGRGSRTPAWLEELGYQRPAEDRVEIGLGYATRTYQLRPGAMGGDLMILTAGTPANPSACTCAGCGSHGMSTPRPRTSPVPSSGNCPGSGRAAFWASSVSCHRCQRSTAGFSRGSCARSPAAGPDHPVEPTTTCRWWVRSRSGRAGDWARR